MAIKRNTRIARPFLVLYQAKNARWYVYGGKTQEEADKKADKLLHSGRVKMCIVTHAMYDARIDEGNTQ